MPNKVLAELMQKKYKNYELKPMAKRRNYKKMSYYDIETKIKGSSKHDLRKEILRENQSKIMRSYVGFARNVRKSMIQLGKHLVVALKPVMEIIKTFYDNPEWEPIILRFEEGIRPSDAVNRHDALMNGINDRIQKEAIERITKGSGNWKNIGTVSNFKLNPKPDFDFKGPDKVNVQIIDDPTKELQRLLKKD